MSYDQCAECCITCRRLPCGDHIWIRYLSFVLVNWKPLTNGFEVSGWLGPTPMCTCMYCYHWFRPTTLHGMSFLHYFRLTPYTVWHSSIIFLNICKWWCTCTCITTVTLPSPQQYHKSSIKSPSLDFTLVALVCIAQKLIVSIVFFLPHLLLPVQLVMVQSRAHLAIKEVCVCVWDHMPSYCGHPPLVVCAVGFVG